METSRDHDAISYLHHTVVTVVDPTSPPLLESLPSFAVNKSNKSIMDLLDDMQSIRTFKCI